MESYFNLFPNTPFWMTLAFVIPFSIWTVACWLFYRSIGRFAVKVWNYLHN